MVYAPHQNAVQRLVGTKQPQFRPDSFDVLLLLFSRSRHQRTISLTRNDNHEISTIITRSDITYVQNHAHNMADNTAQPIGNCQFRLKYRPEVLFNRLTNAREDANSGMINERCFVSSAMVSLNFVACHLRRFIHLPLIV